MTIMPFAMILPIFIPLLIIGAIAYLVSRSPASMSRYSRNRVDRLEARLGSIESKLDNIEKALNKANEKGNW